MREEEEEVDENIARVSAARVASALNLSLEVRAWKGWAHLWRFHWPDGEKNVPSKTLTAPNLTPVKGSMVQMDTLIERQIAVVLQWYYWNQLPIGKSTAVIIP